MLTTIAIKLALCTFFVLATVLPTQANASLRGHGKIANSVKVRDLQAIDCHAYCDRARGVPVEVDGNDFWYAIDEYLLRGTSRYGPILNCWDVSQVTDMSRAFSPRYNFNEPLNCWNTSSVTNMRGMFDSAVEFNQDISSWDVSKVIDMSDMFRAADAFDQDISGWDVSEVTDMSFMFSNADMFNQDLCSWGELVDTTQADTSNRFSNMFLQSGCDDTSEPTTNNWCQSC